MSNGINLVQDGDGTVEEPEMVFIGGKYMSISPEDLVNNPIGIGLLMNAHNDQAKNRKKAETRLADKESELAFLRTSTFVSIVATIVGVLGALVSGIGVSLIPKDGLGIYAWGLVAAGGVLVITSGLSTTLYPHARKWFNKEQPGPLKD